MKASREAEKLSVELQKLHQEHDLLHEKYSLSEQRVQKLEEELKTQIGPNHFRKTLHALKEETEKLRSVYPVQDLLAAKELEIKKTDKTLASVTKTHPQFEFFDLTLRVHLEELEELRVLATKADERFKRQILRIRTAGLMIPFEVVTEGPKQNDGPSEEASSESPQRPDSPRSPPLSLLPIL